MQIRISDFAGQFQILQPRINLAALNTSPITHNNLYRLSLSLAVTMLISPHATCEKLLDTVKYSGLTYTLNETPYSVYGYLLLLEFMHNFPYFDLILKARTYIILKVTSIGKFQVQTQFCTTWASQNIRKTKLGISLFDI